MDGIVLVHGGMHGAWCWDRLRPYLTRPSVAVDLPGRGKRPLDLRSVTLDGCVAAVIEEADAAGMDRFCLVGHSLGGVTITETAYWHPERVASLVYVGALVPGPGESGADIVYGGSMTGDVLEVVTDDTGRDIFANDLTEEQWQACRAKLVPDACSLLNATLSGRPAGIPTTYVRMLRDQAVPSADRRGPTLVRRDPFAERMIANLGEGVDVHTLDAGHTVMVSQPEAVAAILAEVVAATLR